MHAGRTKPRPRPGPRIDPGHPAARHLVCAWHLADGAGRILRDDSGRSNHGSFPGNANDPAWVVGQAGPVLEFTVDDKVSCAVASGLPTAVGAAWSIECRFRLSGTVSLAQVFGFGEDPASAGTTGAKRQLLMFGGTAPNNNIYFWGTNADWDSGIPWPVDGRLHHLIMATAGGSATPTLALHLDGVRVASGLPGAGLIAAPQQVWAGGRHPSGASSFGGRLEYGRIYSADVGVMAPLLAADPYGLIRRRSGGRLISVGAAAPPGIAPSGSTSIPAPASAGTVTVTAPATTAPSGTTSIPAPTSAGTVTVAGPAGVAVAGATSIPGPSSAGTVTVSAAGSISVGGVTLLGGPVSAGTVTVADPAGVTVAGSSMIPAPASAGTVSVASPDDVSISGSVGIPAPLSAGTVTVTGPAGVAPSGSVLLAAPTSAGTVQVLAPGVIAPQGRSDIPAPASAGTVTVVGPAGVAVAGATSIPGPLSSGSVVVTAPGSIVVSGNTSLPSPTSAGTVGVAGPGSIAISGSVVIPPPASSGTVTVGLGAVGATEIAAPLSLGTVEVADAGTILVAGSTLIAAPLSGGMIRDDVAVSLGAAIEARVSATPDLADRLSGGFWWGEAGVLDDGTRAMDRPPYGTLDHVGEVYHYDTSGMPRARVDEWMVRFIGPDDTELHAIVGAWHRTFNNRMARLQVEGERQCGWINMGGQADPSYTPGSTFGYDLGMRMVRCRSFSNI